MPRSAPRPLRVAGTDPGTSSLDVLILEDGSVVDQCRFPASDLQTQPSAPVDWLEQRGPFDLIAGPSGYGLPLVSASELTDQQLQLMTLVRPEERGRSQGVQGFSAVVRAFAACRFPVVFLPGVIHLPTVPTHRKINHIDLGTPDKLCVASLALAQHGPGTFALLELGTTFTALLVVEEGAVVDGLGGTSGAVGWGSGGAWDGELAYLLSPLTKDDLFAGGAKALPDNLRRPFFCESILKCVACLRATTPFSTLYLSGRLLEVEPAICQDIHTMLSASMQVETVGHLPGAWVKHAAQGAALLADGLIGGQHAPLVDVLQLREASGTALDHVWHPRGLALRRIYLESHES